jgi:hypothetical protein
MLITDRLGVGVEVGVGVGRYRGGRCGVGR